MMGYVPRLLPQSYIQTRGFGHAETGYSPPPLVQANASTGGSGTGGVLNFIGSLLGGAFQAGTQSSQEFNAAAGQLEAQRLAAERSRRWASFGAVAVGIAGLAGVVYLLRK